MSAVIFLLCLFQIDNVIIHDPNDFYMRQWLDVQPEAGNIIRILHLFIM
jgi:hypothetical protein